LIIVRRDIMICPKCNHYNSETSQFCGNCGCPLGGTRYSFDASNGPAAGKKPMSNLVRYVLSAVIIIIAIIFTIQTLSGFFGTSKEDLAINAAKTEVSKYLKSPSGTRWMEEEILDKDKYGRYLVYLSFESTNSFGAYVKNSVVVLIGDVSKETYRRYSDFTYTDITGKEVLAYDYDPYNFEILMKYNNWDEQP
jgi:hypothetical protein